MRRRFCLVPFPMPPRKPAPPPMRPRRFWPRLIIPGLALAVFGSLWLLDTGALLHFTRIAALAYPRTTLAILGVFGLTIAISLWRTHTAPPPPPPRQKRPRRPKG
ncbi:MAG: hypothetical protein P4L66_11125 [Acetobacteraceae bacterium]|nr:hypothetical protein [Acetobacteraceae bacterium]